MFDFKYLSTSNVLQILFIIIMDHQVRGRDIFEREVIFM